MSCAVKKRSGAHCASARISELPEDILFSIFSKLDFMEKVNAGQVCKTWDQLLKANSAGARHWGVVRYNVDSVLSSQASTTRKKVPLLQQFESGFGRWVINRAGAIKSVHVSATLSSCQQGDATMKALERHLPLLAGCLSKHDNFMDLRLRGRSPFASPVLSSSDVLTFLCPMVKSLDIWSMSAPLTASQFAAMCKLSKLERLHLHSYPSEAEAQRGLLEMTEEVSQLVNLTSLELLYNHSLRSIPESISRLQKLKAINISGSPIKEVPLGLGNLANLAMLRFDDCGPLRFPHSLQGLKQLTSLGITSCRLKSIPAALCGVPSLTSLNLWFNRFDSRDGWPWWPSALSRLTNLAHLNIAGCGIRSLPPCISGLRGLTELCVDENALHCLPDQLSCLQCLKSLQAHGNCFATVPVSVLSALTTLSTIDLSYQSLGGGLLFKVPSSLLPILHAGLVELDLSHDHEWDALSLCHLGHAMVEVATRVPAVQLQWLEKDDCEDI